MDRPTKRPRIAPRRGGGRWRPGARALLAIPWLLLLLAPGPADPPDLPSRDPLWFGTYARHAVAADHAEASAAGLELLREGGNAADAAAATMLALGVANPASSGLGGGGFALYYRASDRSLTFLDFRERAPGAASAEMYRDAPELGGPMSGASQLGGLATAVPGEAAGIAALVERFGALPLARSVQPAIRLAEGGVAVSGPLARVSEIFGSQLRQDPQTRRWFEPGEASLREGQTLRQPALGRTLRAFARGGRDAFYRGRIAREIVRANRRAGGILTLEDLRDYEVVEREPLEAERFGHRWVTAPPPSAGGFTLLQSLAMLERLPAAWRAPGDRLLHALAESWKGPFLDRQRYFGDPDHVDLPLEALGDPSRAAARARAFHPQLAMPAEDYELPLGPAPAIQQPEGGGTSHLCVIDSEGNIASITTTVNLPFGARYAAAGIVMNDEMDDFARGVGESNAFGLVGGASNLPGPFRRPVSTMSPTIVFGPDGAPILCVGAAGGSRIVTAVEQIALNVLVLEMGLQEAMAAPRVHHQGRPDALRSEEKAPLPEQILALLRARGHRIEPISNVASAQAIRILPGDRRRLEAACDPRKGGRPAGE
ncbi:MAG: gamma-glutamyltransferase [Myxococcales bacterium]|nr:gamma-glutamyltransferase [Myxococcales bacterium]